MVVPDVAVEGMKATFLWKFLHVGKVLHPQNVKFGIPDHKL